MEKALRQVRYWALYDQDQGHCRPSIVSPYYQLSHGCQGDTEKYLTRENLYHPRHTCITRDVVEGNTGVSRVIQFLRVRLFLCITLATM